jgi:hypothetical protein
MKKVLFSVIVTVFISFGVLVYLGTVFTDQFAKEKKDELFKYSERFDVNKNPSDLPKAIQNYKLTNVSGEINYKWCDAQFESFIKTNINSPLLSYPYNQISLIYKPSYLTDGLIKTNDLVSIRSIESFINGKGNLLNKFASSFTISDAKGSQINQNALTRYLLESVLFAPSLLKNNGITFTEIDSNIILAKIELDTLISEVTFYLNKNNEIYLAETHNKFRTTKWGFTKMSHKTEYYDYKQFNKFRIPTRIEHSWVDGERIFTYHKINLINLQYN